ncbi:MAG: hypothetical protein JNJ46_08855 [Myxococcales bacterium]|nr:hypothetical protein [Myxococcales bacterium]
MRSRLSCPHHWARSFLPWLGLFALGCASDHGSQARETTVFGLDRAPTAHRPRGEDLRLLARLGGPQTLFIVSGEWAKQTAERTHQSYDASIPQTQAWLRCAVDPDPVRAKGPLQPSLALPADSVAEYVADLQRVLYRLRITTPEARELVQGLKRCLAVESHP